MGIQASYDFGTDPEPEPAVEICIFRLTIPMEVCIVIESEQVVLLTSD
jgi:hypothetical protein